MIPWFFEFLHRYTSIKIPAVFSYVSTQIIFSALTALLFTIWSGKIFIRFFIKKKFSQPIRSDASQLLTRLHKEKKNTPTMGGVLILSAIVISALLWMNLRHFFTYLFLFVTIAVGSLGAIDDFLKLKFKNSRGLSARKKIIAQCAVAAFVSVILLHPVVTSWMGNYIEMPIVKDRQTHREYSLSEYQRQYYFPFCKKCVFRLSRHFSWLAMLGLIFVFTGSSNAVNLTDGLDGLAAGLVFFAAVVFGFIAFLSSNVEIASYLQIIFISGSGQIAIFLSGLCGGCLGFLWYNSYPAQIFMGDVGSLTLGALLGLSAILLRRELLLALVGGLFVIEAVSVILQVLSYRYRGKKRVFLCSPLHHHFEYQGIPETKVVLRFWIIGIILALIGLVTVKLQ